MSTGLIRIRGARQNNLKNLDLDIRTGEMTVVTGPSGSGKSSLVFDTLYAEGQRRYVETFSAYARQFLERMDRPAVDRVDGVPPWTVFRRITLPLILPGLLVAVVFRTLDALRVFDLIYVMTSNSRNTKSMSVFVREQLIDFGLVGYGSAAATCLFFLVALLSIVAIGLMRRSFDRVAA